jgi:hypothetical protein
MVMILGLAFIIVGVVLDIGFDDKYGRISLIAGSLIGMVGLSLPREIKNIDGDKRGNFLPKSRNEAILLLLVICGAIISIFLMIGVNPKIVFFLLPFSAAFIIAVVRARY